MGGVPAERATRAASGPRSPWCRPRPRSPGSHHLGTHRYAGHPPGCTWEYVTLRTVCGRAELWCKATGCPLGRPLCADRPPSPDARAAASPHGQRIRGGASTSRTSRSSAAAATRRRTEPLARWVFGEVRDAMSLPRQIGSLLGDGDVPAWPRRPGAARPGGVRCLRLGRVGRAPAPHELVVRLRGGLSMAKWIGRPAVRRSSPIGALASWPVRSIDEVELDRADYRSSWSRSSSREPRWIEVRLYSTGTAAFWVDSMALVSVTPSGAFQPPGESCEGPSHSAAPEEVWLSRRTVIGRPRGRDHAVAPTSVSRARAAAMLRSLMSS